MIPTMMSTAEPRMNQRFLPTKSNTSYLNGPVGVLGSTPNSEGFLVAQVPLNKRRNVRVMTMAVNILKATPINRVTAKPFTGALSSMLLPNQ